LARISLYLTFNGNCREAMNFYRDCFGGSLIFQTLGESPLSEKMPRKMRDSILHSTLLNGILVVKGSDLVQDSGLIRGNAISLSLECSSEKEITQYYEKLSVGGQVTHPLEKTFWGALFGTLTDRYGIHWLLNYHKENRSKKDSFTLKMEK
jgi:PhnB protein